MKVSYKRRGRRSYLMIPVEDADNTENYQVRIFLENQIQGLLLCNVYRMNGEEFFQYEITGTQSLQHLYEKRKFHKNDIEELFQAVAEVMEHMDIYMLDLKFLLLQPAYIYVKEDPKKYSFLWFPYEEESFEISIRSLTEYLLPRIDHGDKRAVSMGYGLYREAVDGNLTAEVMKEKLWEDTLEPQVKEKKQENFLFQAGEEKEAERQKILDDFYKEEEEEKNSYGIIGGLVILVCLVSGVFFAFHYRLFSPAYLLLFIILALGLCALGGVFYYILKRKLNKEDKQALQKEEIDFKTSVKKEEKELSKELLKSEPEEELTEVLVEEIMAEAYLKRAEGKCEETYPISGTSTFIGKKRECVDICLEDATVSRIHAKIIREGGKDYLIDLNSRNGTILEGIYLNPEEKYLLHNGDTIIFAKEKFWYLENDYSDNYEE